MTVPDWKTARIRGELCSQVEDAVYSIKVRNMPKYDSVADFIEKACIALLDKEGIKAEVVA
jgi:hypothetical protein